MEHIIYKLTAPNGKVYIGRTKNWKNRLKEHKCIAKYDKRHSHLYKSIRKYGWENFKKEIIGSAPNESAAIILEEAVIRKFDTVNNGLNESYITSGGGDQITNNEYVKERHRKTLSEMFSGKNNPMYGRKQTDEAKLKQKEKAKGRFSLPWFIERHGMDEGTKLYNARSETRRQNMIKRYHPHR